MFRTFNPNNRRRRKVHGFFSRMFSTSGRKVLSSRRKKGRYKLCP